MSNTARIAMRVAPEYKAEAERAAAILGNKSLTDFIMQAALEKARKVLDEHQRLTLSNQDFDNFVMACENAEPPSSKLLSLAEKADQQGFK